jgi:murein L,D-transpeptidase YcbB/YkuD
MAGMRALRVLGAAASAWAVGVATLPAPAEAQVYYQYRAPWGERVPGPAHGYGHGPYGYAYPHHLPYGYRGYPDREPRAQSDRRSITVPRVRVQSPSYYTYAPDRFKKVAFEELAQLEIASKDGLEPGRADSFFRSKASLATLSLRTLPEVGEAIVGHYLQHPRFLWVENGRMNDRAARALAVLADAAAFGLNPADYQIRSIESRAADDVHAALARFEMEFSAAVLLYVVDARRGRIDPNRISGYHHLARKEVDLSSALAALAETNDVRGYLLQQHPDNAPFRALTAELARLRTARPSPAFTVHKTVRPGESSEQLPQIVDAIRKNASADLRRRHARTFKAYKRGNHYDKMLIELVRDFQREQGVNADGIIRQSTFPAVKPADNDAQIRKIEFALERLRWLPRDLGRQHVFINQPAFTASYVTEDEPVLSMRTVIGKKETQTYFFSDRIEYIEYNPNWNVPHSILVNKMLPQLAKDSRFLEREGYEVINSAGKRVSAASVDWARVAAKQVSVTVRQRPSEDNALGALKIMFPNDHAIYMHDTPQKSLFAKPSRAFSNGCIRLENAAAMAAAVLQKDASHVASRIASERTSSEKVSGELPVHVAYFTAWPAHDGKISYFDDIYDRDDYLAKAIAATDAERRVN